MMGSVPKERQTNNYSSCLLALLVGPLAPLHCSEEGRFKSKETAVKWELSEVMSVGDVVGFFGVEKSRSQQR